MPADTALSSPTHPSQEGMSSPFHPAHLMTHSSATVAVMMSGATSAVPTSAAAWSAASEASDSRHVGLNTCEVQEGGKPGAVIECRLARYTAISSRRRVAAGRWEGSKWKGNAYVQCTRHFVCVVVQVPVVHPCRTPCPTLRSPAEARPNLVPYMPYACFIAIIYRCASATPPPALLLR